MTSVPFAAFGLNPILIFSLSVLSVSSAYSRSRVGQEFGLNLFVAWTFESSKVIPFSGIRCVLFFHPLFTTFLELWMKLFGMVLWDCLHSSVTEFKLMCGLGFLVFIQWLYMIAPLYISLVDWLLSRCSKFPCCFCAVGLFVLHMKSRFGIPFLEGETLFHTDAFLTWFTLSIVSFFDLVNYKIFICQKNLKRHILLWYTTHILRNNLTLTLVKVILYGKPLWE